MRSSLGYHVIQGNVRRVALYGRLPHRLHRTPPRWRASPWAFFYDPCTQLCRHLLHITAIECQFVANLLVRHVESHEIQTQDPDFQRLMMPAKMVSVRSSKRVSWCQDTFSKVAS